jgi:prolyl-tRNA synthetase
MFFLSLRRYGLAFSYLPTSRFMTRNPISFKSISLRSVPLELSEDQKVDLQLKIKEKGDAIRALKEAGGVKSDIAGLVDELKALKAQLDPVVSSNAPPAKAKHASGKAQDGGIEEEESDFITARNVDYSRWYQDIIRVTGLAEPSPVRGCMVIKPWGMSLWDAIRTDLDRRIQEHGAENAYFPLLIPKSFLSKEAEHVDGFAKECAVVTHHRLTAAPDGSGLIADPEAELEDPLIIRPTSETMIWFMFRKWINSYRSVQLSEFISQNEWALHPNVIIFFFYHQRFANKGQPVGECDALGTANATVPTNF